MAKMRIYTVHINPKKNHPYESPIFVEEGLNWPAFFFQWMWALYHKLWLAAFGIFAFNAMLSYLNFNGILHPLSIIILQLGFQFFIASHGNDLKRYALKKRGYITADIVTSDNLVGAEQRYFERYAKYMHHPPSQPVEA
ncbi:MAG: DUF2628 domain-containing protein [Rickettsiales bacterium]